MTILTVSQLNRYVKSVVEDDKRLGDVYIRGEVSNFTNHYRSGHFYFSLKDEKSAVKAVMFQSHASELPFMPENGMKVLARAGVGVFERDGVYQLYVTDMQPDGAGALYLAYEQRRRKLGDEGLFDAGRKRPLPPYPSVIGVVTSENGAAFGDIVNVLSRRWPLCKVMLYPALVQGKGAAESLIKGLRALDGKCGVIILGRGGGSAEDLWEFNDENLVRAVAASSTPVIAAIGHETDTTLCDFAADVRAPTPSAAAEIAAPSVGEVRQRLSLFERGLLKSAQSAVMGAEEALDRLTASPALRNPAFLLEKKRERLDFIAGLLYNNKRSMFERYEMKLSRQAGRMDSLSPLRVLARGYAAAFKNGKPETAAGLVAGDMIDIRFYDGTIAAEVKDTRPADKE